MELQTDFTKWRLFRRVCWLRVSIEEVLNERCQRIPMGRFNRCFRHRPKRQCADTIPCLLVVRCGIHGLSGAGKQRKEPEALYENIAAPAVTIAQVPVCEGIDRR